MFIAFEYFVCKERGARIIRFRYHLMRAKAPRSLGL